MGAAAVTESDPTKSSRAAEHTGKIAVAAGINCERLAGVKVGAAGLFGPEHIAGAVVFGDKDVRTVRRGVIHQSEGPKICRWAFEIAGHETISRRVNRDAISNII